MNGLKYLNDLMTLMIKNVDYLSQYMEVTDEHIKAIEKHYVKYNINPEICAWYKDMDDFYSDWMTIGYTKETAERLYKDCKAEFQTFSNGNIIRYVI